jgi:hypothetical protein
MMKSWTSLAFVWARTTRKSNSPTQPPPAGEDDGGGKL